MAYPQALSLTRGSAELKRWGYSPLSSYAPLALDFSGAAFALSVESLMVVMQSWPAHAPPPGLPAGRHGYGGTGPLAGVARRLA